VVLGAAAIAIRLILFVAYSPVLTNDSHSYLDLAHRLGAAHLHGSSGARTPGYPVVLLALGYSPRAAWVLQALLGILATFLVYALVRRLGGGSTVALAAGLLYTLDLDVLAVEHMVMTEAIASFLLLVAAHLALTVLERASPRARSWTAPALLLALTIAYLCLVRPDMLILGAYLVLTLAIATHSARPLWILVPALAVLVAWAGANRATIGVFTVSTVLGHNMIDHVAKYVTVEPGRNHGITAAYVAAREQRERHTSDLGNLSADAEAAMERASHLDAAHLSGRLLSIGLGVIAHHPVQYVASSVKQWPRFWLPPNYAYQFTGGAIRVVWKLERALIVLVNIVFVLLVAVDLARRASRRDGLLSPPALILAGLVVLGLLPATFLAYGETGRYGYIYLPLVLGVSFATGEIVLRRLRAPALAPASRPRPSRI